MSLSFESSYNIIAVSLKQMGQAPLWTPSRPERLRIPPRPQITEVVREGSPLGKSPGKSSHPLLDCKTAYLQALRYAGGGT